MIEIAALLWFLVNSGVKMIAYRLLDRRAAGAAPAVPLGSRLGADAGSH